MQTVIRVNPDKAFPGMLADTSYKRAVSRAVGEDAGLIPGVFVVERKADRKVFKAGTADSFYVGVTLHDQTLAGFLVPTAANNPSTNGIAQLSPLYEKTRAASILQRGAVWVLVATGSTIANGDAVSMVTAATETGYATTGTTNAVAVPGAQARGAIETLADGRRIIEIELGAGNL